MMFTVFFFNLRNMFSARQFFFQMDWHCRLYILIWLAVFLHLIHMFFDWSSYFPYCCVNQFLLLPNASMFWLQVVQFSSIATWGINPNTITLGWIPMETVSFFGVSRSFLQFPRFPLPAYPVWRVFSSFLSWSSSALLRKLRLQRFMVDAMRWQELTNESRWFKEKNTLNLNVDWLGFLRCFFLVLGVLGVDVRRYYII